MQTLLVLCALHASVRSCAQTIDPISAQQRPILGVGHEYVGRGVEMVNPADGNVSFDLPISSPPARGPQVSLHVKYTSAEPFYLDYATQDGPGFSWRTPIQNGDPRPFDINGWSYSLPNYTAESLFIQSAPVNCSPSSTCNTYNNCYATADYNFQDLEGTSHTLLAGNLWLGSGSSNVFQNNCQSFGYAGYGGFAQPDFDGITPQFGTPTPPGSNFQPSLSVMDRSGTQYQFPQNTDISIGHAFGQLAQTVSDRNGNTITLNGITGSIAGVLPAGSYTDTAGRPAISWSGMGNSGGDSIGVSGLNPIVVKWTATSVTMPTASTSLSSTNNKPCAFSGPAQPLSVQVVSEIDLPNSTHYSFSYGGTYGLLSKITFPNRGYIRYVWGPNQKSKVAYDVYVTSAPNSTTPGNCSASIDTPAVVDRYESFDGTTESFHQHFTYSTQITPDGVYGATWTSKATTITSTDTTTGQTRSTTHSYIPGVAVLGLNDGPHLQTNSSGGFVSAAEWQVPEVPLESQTIEQDGTGVLLTTNKSWWNNTFLVGQQNILNDGQGSTVLRCPDDFDNPIAAYEYDFQKNGARPSDPSCARISGLLSAGLTTAAIGPLLRQTATSYHRFPSPSYAIRDRPDSISVSDSTGLLKQTSYTYDETNVASSGAQLGLLPPPNTGANGTAVASRANATSVTHWLNTGQPSPVTTYTYYDTGQVQSITDPCGNTVCAGMPIASHKTVFSYQDSWSSLGAPGQTSALLTSTTNPLGQKTSYIYDYATGNISSSTDSNLQQTSYGYNDPLVRIKDIFGPPSSQNNGASPHTSFNYVDGPQSSVQATGPTGITNFQAKDGFDRVLQTRLTSDPALQVVVDITYDAYGNTQSTSNPYHSKSESSYGVTSFLYDGLNRKTTQCQPDNGSAASIVCSPGKSFQSWKYNGSTTTYTDEQSHQWQRTNDALGRLIQVIEPNNSATTYGYYGLDNLHTADQTGVSERIFIYDSLSRLNTSTNPETGTICYGVRVNGVCGQGYDANGNLQDRTDARGVSTHFGYDSLNRLLAKSYVNDASGSPSICFQYDLSVAGIGKLSSQWTQKGPCPASPPASGALTKTVIAAYDEMGRVKSQQQCVLTQCSIDYPGHMTYEYDLAGKLTTQNDGVGNTLFSNSYNGVGRLQSVTSSWNDAVHPPALFSGATYIAAGTLEGVSYGPGLTRARTYDSRLRISTEVDQGQIIQSSGVSGSAIVTITGSVQSK